MATPFDPGERAFSQRAHVGAVAQWYPFWLGDPTIECKSEQWDTHSDRGRVLDGQFAVDCCLHVAYPTHRYRRVLTVQERFRRPCHKGYGDITITYANRQTDQPSEAFKSTAMYMVYGFWDDQNGVLLEAWSILMHSMLNAFFCDALRCKRVLNPRSQQEFVGIQISELLACGLVESYLLPPVPGEARQYKLLDPRTMQLGEVRTIPLVKQEG